MRRGPCTPVCILYLSERGAKDAAKKTVKVKTAAMLTAEAEAVKHLVEPSDFFKEQFGRENRFGETGQECQGRSRSCSGPCVLLRRLLLW